MRTTKAVSHGYSLRLRELNRRAPSTMLGVRLGRACIKQNISATQVAEDMGVSRQTVYNWFKGISSPAPTLTETIEQYVASLG